MFWGQWFCVQTMVLYLCDDHRHGEGEADTEEDAGDEEEGRHHSRRTLLFWFNVPVK